MRTRLTIYDIIGLEERLRQITSPTVTKMNTNDIDQVATVTYLGKSLNSVWRIEKITDLGSGDMQKRYATVDNNPSHTSYASAWSNRLVLDYNILP